jgi:hypothetical protein
VVARDLDKAAQCYRVAAQGGDFRGAFNHARMLGAAGEIEEALTWLRRTGETATPAFVGKARDWLSASPVPAFPTRGVEALEAGVAAARLSGPATSAAAPGRRPATGA